MKIKRKYLFHLTDGKRLNSINSDGFIKAKIPFRSYMFPLCLFRPKAVYLTENPLHWSFIYDEFKNIVLLKIDITGLIINKDYSHGVCDYFCKTSIPINRIKEIFPFKDMIINDELKIVSIIK